jgi:hypothetical protein
MTQVVSLCSSVTPLPRVNIQNFIGGSGTVSVLYESLPRRFYPLLSGSLSTQRPQSEPFERPAVAVPVNHRMAVCAHDGQILEEYLSTFRGRLLQRNEVMHLGVTFAE